MARTIKIKLFKYHELKTDEAREKALAELSALQMGLPEALSREFLEDGTYFHAKDLGVE